MQKSKNFNLSSVHNCEYSFYHLYKITELRFIELLLVEWDAYIERTHKKLMNKFVEFDDNGDGVLTFDEFETLLNNLGKNLIKTTKY